MATRYWKQSSTARCKWKTFSADDTEYKLTPGLFVLIPKKHPRAGQWNSNDYQVYKSRVAQTRVKLFPNRTGAARPTLNTGHNQLAIKVSADN